MAPLIGDHITLPPGHNKLLGTDAKIVSTDQLLTSVWLNLLGEQVGIETDSPASIIFILDMVLPHDWIGNTFAKNAKNSVERAIV